VKRRKRAMIRFLMGVIVGILLFFLFIYFGGSVTVKKVAEGLTDAGKKMEVIEQIIKKEKGEVEKDVKKKTLKEYKGATKKKETQR
jgi:predicted nucleotidyltransferase